MGIGWEDNNAHTNENASGNPVYEQTNASHIKLSWTLAVTDDEAYFFIGGTLMKKFTNVTKAFEHLNIGSQNCGVKLYDIDLVMKSADEAAYANKLAELKITY